MEEGKEWVMDYGRTKNAGLYRWVRWSRRGGRTKEKGGNMGKITDVIKMH
jgi:hypothetical protein